VYDVLKYVHILAAMVWVGGAFTLQIYGIYVSRSSEPDAIARFGRDVAVVGGRVFPIASIVLLIAGVLMVLQRWSFGQAWIQIVAGRALMNQVFLVSRLELVSFAVVIALMVFKPGAA
jgi:uncharacterized membrane protein